MELKIKYDYLVISLLFILIPIDLINGILLHNGIFLPISLSQLFKLFVLVLFSVKLLQSPKKIETVVVLFLLLMVPSLYQFVLSMNFALVVYDAIKISRYLLPLISFFYFSNFFLSSDQQKVNYAFKFIRFSYWLTTLSVLLKYIGLGFPMYKVGNIGSRGLFHAGNELSFLLMILAAIMAFDIWSKKKIKKFFFFAVFNLFIAFLLSSKTAIIGILILFFAIPIKPPKIKIRLKKLRYLLFTFVFILPLTLVFSWNFIRKSSLFERFAFFWEKLDLVTFIFSSRNIFAKKSWAVFLEQYNLFEKLVGVGQKKFEMLNQNKIIEIDFLDIFFTYGFLGTLLFVAFLIGLYQTIYIKSRKVWIYPYANFVRFMFFLIIAISITAGHVFNSGLAGVFLGFIFSLIYVKNQERL